MTVPFLTVPSLNLRWRLALLAGVVSGVLIVATFLALFFAVRGTLVGVLNDSLRAGVNFRLADEVRRAQQGDQAGPDRHPGDDGRPRLDRPTPPGLATVVSLDASGNVTRGEPPLRAPLLSGFQRLAGYRVLSVRSPQTGGWVQAYRAEDELLSSLHGVTQLFSVVAPLAVLLALVGGYFLADRALRPVDAVTRLAGHIAASGRYGERVPQAGGRDEMARLTGTINAMLDRLAGLIERERAFALAAAHELRTPLAVIRARASLALEREREGPQYRAALAEVRDVSSELTGLTDRLLTLARSAQSAQRQPAPATASSGPPQPSPELAHIDLADVALEVAELQGPAADLAGVQIELDLHAAEVRGDRTALMLAASNLLQNAVRYGGVGGQVRVRTRLEGGLACLSVEDDGPGIPEADLPRLRQPFQRGRGLQGQEGAGLGLALVSAVAEQHGGELHLGRATGGGLRAELRLAPATPHGPAPATRHPVSGA